MKKMLEFVFSPNGFLLVPLVIILFIIVSNIEPIMDKMGFETRSHLKSELSKANYTVSLLKEEIKTLKLYQEKSDKQCEIKEEIIEQHTKDSEALDEYIKDVIHTNTINSSIPSKDLIKVEIEEIETSQIEPLNNNIVAINNVYNELFGG